MAPRGNAPEPGRTTPTFDSAKLTQAPRDQEGRLQGKVTATAPTVLYTVARLFQSWVDSTTYTTAMIRSVLQRADAGELWPQLAMYRKMIEMDGSLGNAVDTRRGSIMRAERELRPPRGLEADRKALYSVDYCRDVLDQMAGYPDCLEWMQDGPILGFVGLELEWWQRIPIAISMTPDECWLWGAWSSTPTWSVETSSGNVGGQTPLRKTGIGLQVMDYAGHFIDVPENKFLVYSPPGTSRSFTRRGAMRGCVWPWNVRNLGVADWATYTEIFGVPPRILQTDRDKNDPVVAEVFAAIKAMAAAGVAIIPDGFELMNLSSVARSGGSPHPEIIRWAEHTMARRMLGQVLTTDTSGATGTLSAAVVAKDVLQERAEADARGAAAAFRRDVLWPMVGYGLGWDWPVPDYVLEVPNRDQRKADAEFFAICKNKLGMRIPAAPLYSLLKVPQPHDLVEGEEIQGEQVKPGSAPILATAPGGHVHGSAGDPVTGDDSAALDKLASLSDEQWQELQDDSLMLQVARIVEEHPELTPGSIAERVAWFYPQLAHDELAGAIERVLLAAQANGHVAVAAEASEVTDAAGG